MKVIGWVFRFCDKCGVECKCNVVLDDDRVLVVCDNCLVGLGD